MDRLINNTVNVTTGSQAEQFVKLADGSYHPQPASSSRLSLDGNTYTLTYKDTTTLPEGDATSYVYDTMVNPRANNISNMTRISKDATATATTNYLYDPIVNKPIQITRPPPIPEPNPPPCLTCQITTLTYDPANGNVASIVPDSGRIAPRTRYTYSGLGQVASTTDPLGIVTTFAYDTAGNRLSMVEDAGPGRLNRTTAYGYNERGDVVSVTDPNGNVTRYDYDAGRRLVTTTSPATAAAPGGIVTTNSYDAGGRLLQVQQSSGGTLLRTTSATWTPTGKLATATDAKDNVTRYDYDLLDRQVALTDAMGRVTKFTYDNVSRPLTTFNPEIRNPAAPLEPAPLLTQSWTGDGKLASLTDANGNATTFTYDGFNRLSITTYPAPDMGSPVTTEILTYDSVDNVLSRKTRAGGLITFEYDTLYRLIKKTPPSGPVVSYSYDLAGRPTRTSDTSAPIVAAVPPGGSTVTYGTTYTYDALNRPTKVTWDPAPTATAPAAGTLVTFGHSYDKTNRRIGQTVDDNTWLAYPAGAPSTTSYTADKLNRYSAVTGLAPSYDTNGNFTGDGTYTYGYDPENRMVSASGAGNSAAYAYDGRGWRKSRTVNGTTTISVTDADNREVLEYDGNSGAVLRWYAYDLGPNGVLNQMNVPGDTRGAFVSDLQGSIIGTFNSAGALSKTAYLAYGGSAVAATPFGYTGQRLDSESGGLYYYRARHYSPSLGRFLQSDPVGYSAESNLYAYAGNNPLSALDPLGLWTIQVGGQVNIGFWGIGSLSFGVGIVADSQGNAGTYWSFGLGGGVGAYAKATLGGAATSASTIFDLQSDFGPYGLTRATSVTAGTGVGGSFDFGQYVRPGSEYTSVGGSVGAVSGVGISNQMQWTEITPYVDWRDTNNQAAFSNPGQASMQPIGAQSFSQPTSYTPQSSPFETSTMQWPISNYRPPK